MPPLRRLLLAGLALAAVGPAAPARGQAAAQASAADLAFDRLDEAAPDFTYLDDGGRAHRLKDALGRPLLLHFWATWCTSCRLELPELGATAGRLRDRNITVLAISVDAQAQRPAVRQFLAGLGRGAPDAHLADKDEDGVKPYLTWGLPVTYVVTAAGKIVARALGPRSWAKIPDAQLAALLARGAAPALKTGG